MQNVRHSDLSIGVAYAAMGMHTPTPDQQTPEPDTTYVHTQRSEVRKEAKLLKRSVLSGVDVKSKILTHGLLVVCPSRLQFVTYMRSQLTTSTTRSQLQ